STRRTVVWQARRMPVLGLAVLTKPRWLDEHWDVLVIKPVRILLIVLVALVLRASISRALTRLTRVTEAAAPALLRPLRERAGAVLEHPVLSERRRQRAETIASILRSLVSFTVLGLASMLILSEVGINLAPILASAGIAGVALGFGAQNL